MAVKTEKIEKKRTSAPVRKKKGVVREWTETIVFAVTVASLVHWLVMQPYTIPTGSMEKSLLVGDFLFVSKFHYGARTPKTPLHIPLSDNKIWGTNIPSYLKWIQLPMYRLPGLTKVKNNDVVVFNWPGDTESPADLKTHYIKRCIAIGGDTLHIVEGKVFVNSKAIEVPPGMQMSYLVESKQPLNEKTFKKLGINYSRSELSNQDDVPQVSPDEMTYIILMNQSTAEQMKKLDFIKSVTQYISRNDQTGTSQGIYPGSADFKWTIDNFGPIYVPQKGKTISITPQNLTLYQKVFLEYEDNEDAKIENNQLFIDGKAVTEYTFKQNYYWMMGDNRHNSEDSRFWGFVPENYIVGKALFVWWSVDSFESWSNPFKKIRWSRIGKGIE
jgi:signal peptidase I